MGSTEVPSLRVQNTSLVCTPLDNSNGQNVATFRYSAQNFSVGGVGGTSAHYRVYTFQLYIQGPNKGPPDGTLDSMNS